MGVVDPNQFLALLLQVKEGAHLFLRIHAKPSWAVQCISNGKHDLHLVAGASEESAGLLRECGPRVTQHGIQVLAAKVDAPGAHRARDYNRCTPTSEVAGATSEVGPSYRETSMNEPHAIVTRNLVKHYGRVEALRGIDLDVRKMEIFGFLGPNGAGKTTTIRCLLDLIRPTKGSISVFGTNPQTDPVSVRARTGYLPGELRLDENLTVEGTLRYLNNLRGRKADWSYIRELAQRLDLELRLPIKNLSKGNKQKIGILQAMMHRPELLILDEPTFGLDPLVQHEVLRLIQQARTEGASVFFSSHNLSEVQEVADRVGIIRLGKLVEVADTSALINRSIRRARIRFRQPVDPSPLLTVPGVSLLARGDGANVLLQVEGEMDRLLKALAPFPVSDFETERPTLEEIFLAYYEKENVEGVQA